ncbi:MAG: 16S rRNA (guanine(966)-N(2))-methyltransferase RsmD [Clostridia bacterium]|nr:16S rRNA (guanine(966)-N(2))-methyltransferase RsmD [Clostridia bacterium]
MRVISGSARGRKLIAPNGLDTRPTTDRVKESIFNIIMPYLPANCVLDLFSGSGAMGIESLSRGSNHCTFVENNKDAQKVTVQNIELSKVGDRADVVFGDAMEYLDKSNRQFDVIFLDPPYNTGLLTKAITKIFENNLLSGNGIIVAESEYMGEEPTSDFFSIKKTAKYGKTTVFILQKKTFQGE